MIDFEPESDGFSEQMNAALGDLRAPDDLEAGIVSRLRSRDMAARFSGKNHPLIYRAAIAAAAIIVVGGTGWYGSQLLLNQSKPVYSQAIRGRDLVSTNRMPALRQARGEEQVREPVFADTLGSSILGKGSVERQDIPVVAAKPSVAPRVTYLNGIDSTLDFNKSVLEAPGDVAGKIATGLGAAASSTDDGVEKSKDRIDFGFISRGGRGGRGGEAIGGVAGDQQLAVASAAPSEAPPAAQSTTPPAPAETAPISAPTAAVIADRKIIRTGEMEFEVESFDAAYQRLTTIVHESGGYIGTTDSQRLPNGKVQGSVTLRVPPENLDTLVLKLRGLGDLKRQQISAQDITKEYTDLQSQLRAAKAMEDRLLEIIKTAHAQVKDLLAAEKELGAWREKDEQLTGQIGYYNNRVALSTLTVTLSEKDINQAAMAHETETVNAGLEAEDVSRARDEVLRAVESAKGRIMQADLNEREAGQFTATVVATIPPGAAGSVVDRLRQLGRVTRLESSLRQTATGEPAAAGLKVQRSDTVLNLSIYNVAAYAARTTDNLSLACDDVESAYKALLDLVKKSDGGRVINSSLIRPTPDTAVGVVVFDVKESSADATLAFLRASGAILQLNVTENADAGNVTTTQRAFRVTLNPLANIAPQETDEITLLPKNGDLQAAYTQLLQYANQPASHARVVDKNLQQENGVYTNASILMEVQRSTLAEAQGAIAEAGKVVAQKATRQPDSANVIDSKVLFRFSFVNVDALQPRQTFNRDIAADDVAGAYQAILDSVKAAGGKIRTAQLLGEAGQKSNAVLEFDLPAEKQPEVTAVIDRVATVFGGTVIGAPESEAVTDATVRVHLQLAEADELTPHRMYQLEIQASKPEIAAADVIAAAQAAGGRIVEHSTSTDAAGHASTRLTVDSPLAKAAVIVDAARGKGTLLRDDSSENAQAPTGLAARAHLEMNFVSEPGVVADNNGLSATIKQGIVTSVRGLLWSLQMLVIGICLIGPWFLVGWGVWRWGRRKTRG